MRSPLFAAVVATLAVACGHLLSQQPQSAEEKFRRAVVKDGIVLTPSPAESLTDSSKSLLFPSYDPQFPPPKGVTPFRLSQEYPAAYNPEETFPWSSIDFRVKPRPGDNGNNWKGYMDAVLKYCLEGNIEVEFRGQDNKTRKWYHAPWMHDDSEDKQAGRRQGREYHRGLTRERRSRKGELHPLQTTDRIQNWAVSLYNARGGYTIGRVWLTPDGFPAPTQATFPDHTVTFKLLFSAASVAEVPFLKGRPGTALADGYKWAANINPAQTQPGMPFNRVDQEMRLLQVDVAVKDPRVGSGSGWVFGTFIYDGSRPGDTLKDKFVPVGVSWGDDSGEQSLIDRDGAFENAKLVESNLNLELINKTPADPKAWGDRAYVTHHGLGGRLNGPVDNPYSSCISCHGRAGTYAAALPLTDRSGLPMPILAGKDAALGSKEEQIKGFGQFFRLIRGNSHEATGILIAAEPGQLTSTGADLEKNKRTLSDLKRLCNIN